MKDRLWRNLDWPGEPIFCTLVLRTEHQFLVRGGKMADAKITVRNNGPYRIEGDFTIYDQEGKAFGLAGRTAVSLCRCGHSENKPFCDGSHSRVGFKSEVKARELPPQAPKPA
jgi:CDGSH-type Zn-finger protein